MKIEEIRRNSNNQIEKLQEESRSKGRLIEKHDSIVSDLKYELSNVQSQLDHQISERESFERQLSTSQEKLKSIEQQLNQQIDESKKLQSILIEKSQESIHLHEIIDQFQSKLKSIEFEHQQQLQSTINSFESRSKSEKEQLV